MVGIVERKIKKMFTVVDSSVRRFIASKSEIWNVLKEVVFPACKEFCSLFVASWTVVQLIQQMQLKGGKYAAWLAQSETKLVTGRVTEDPCSSGVFTNPDIDLNLAANLIPK